MSITHYVQSWFARADEDLALVNLVLEKGTGSPNLACFHTQQAAEKYLKGFLAHHETHARKIHDLKTLTDECQKIDSLFSQLHNDAQYLNQFYIESRYPDDFIAFGYEDAEKAFDNMLECYEAKYPKAMECLRKDRSALLAFYNFPAEHWVHTRTTNPIESAFATVRLRSKRSKNCGSRETTLTMVFKLLECAEKRWRKFKGFGKLELVINNVLFKDGEMILSPGDRIAA